MLDPTSYKPSTINVLIDRACQKLEEKWVGHAPSRPEVCLKTSVNYILGNDDELNAIRCIHCAAAALAQRKGFHNVVAYNDARGRTKKQVLDFMEEVRETVLLGEGQYSKVLRVFAKARNSLFERWVGRAPKSYKGEICIATALRKVADVPDCDVLWIIMEAGRRVAHRHGYECIADYNDAPGRTIIDVNNFLGDAEVEAFNIVMGDMEGRAALPLKEPATP